MTESELLALFAPKTDAQKIAAGLLPDLDIPVPALDAETALADWVAHLNTLATHVQFELVPNPRGKYRRVVALRNGGGASVHAFVDNDGNIYKAAGWKGGPAKDSTGKPSVRFNAVRDYASLTSLPEGAVYGGYLYLR